MYGGCLVVGWQIAWIQQARHNRSAAFKLYMYSNCTYGILSYT